MKIPDGDGRQDRCRLRSENRFRWLDGSSSWATTSMSKRAILPSLCASVLLLAPVPMTAAEPAAKPAEKPASTNAPVSVFKDKKLEDAVRRQVFAKRESKEPLTAADVATVSTVSAPFSGISSLAGLEHCVALASLEVPGNKIADLAPLAGLKQLQYVNLASNQVSVIAPPSSTSRFCRNDAAQAAMRGAGSRGSPACCNAR